MPMVPLTRGLLGMMLLAGCCEARSLGAVGSAAPTGIRKVIDLLQGMKAQIEKEGKADDTAMEDYSCWCKTNEAAKTAAVEAAEQKIAELEAFLERAVGLIGQLETEISGLTADIADSQESLSQASALREQEAAEFAGEEKDMKECLAALQEAVKVLAKVQLLQKRGAGAAEVRPLLLDLQHLALAHSPALSRYRGVMQRDLFDVLGSLGPTPAGEKFLPKRQLSALEGQERLLPWEQTEEEAGQDAKPNEQQGSAAGAKSYNSASGQVLGLLKSMEDQFRSNLAGAHKAELEAIITFQHMKAAKLAEIAAATKMKESKEATLADTKQKVAEAKDDLAATKEALSADQKFLVNLTKACKAAEEEHATRTHNRNEEIRAIGEAIGILTADDTRDLFSKTLSFAQIGAVHEHERAKGRASTAQGKAVESAVRKILAVARQQKDWSLASLAVRVKLDGFEKVKAMMDKMLSELSAQQKNEYKKSESCKTEIDQTEDSIKEGGHTREDLEDKKKALEGEISQLHADIDGLKNEVAEMLQSLKKAGEDRKAENQNFQASMADQRATIQILKKALARLQQFYLTKAEREKAAAAAGVQPSLAEVGTRGRQPGQPVAPPPPTGAAYRKSEGGGGVLQLITMIIEDAERDEIEIAADEQHAQEAYASFSNDATASIQANRAAITEKEERLAGADGEAAETGGALLANAKHLEELNSLLKGVHLDCDYLLKYFDLRQKARAEEMDAIKEAKAILSGADFATAQDAVDG